MKSPHGGIAAAPAMAPIWSASAASARLTRASAAACARFEIRLA
jgi:hypothetical protein